MMRLTRYGHLEHLHFGAPVQTGDAAALSCRPGLGWGSSVLLSEGDTQGICS